MNMSIRKRNYKQNKIWGLWKQSRKIIYNTLDEQI